MLIKAFIILSCRVRLSVFSCQKHERIWTCGLLPCVPVSSKLHQMSLKYVRVCVNFGLLNFLISYEDWYFQTISKLFHNWHPASSDSASLQWLQCLKRNIGHSDKTKSESKDWIWIQWKFLSLEWLCVFLAMQYDIFFLKRSSQTFYGKQRKKKKRLHWSKDGERFFHLKS